MDVSGSLVYWVLDRSIKLWIGLNYNQLKLVG
jgi:hypothetical protein